MQTKNILTVGGSKINVEIARTASEQRLGLGQRDTISEDSGMLFVLALPEKQAFWMKDMRFPLDFIWINDDKVIEITADVPAEVGIPDQSLKIYMPASPVDQVLEVNAGWAKRHGITIGDSINLTQE